MNWRVATRITRAVRTAFAIPTWTIRGEDAADVAHTVGPLQTCGYRRRLRAWPPVLQNTQSAIQNQWKGIIYESGDLA